MDVFIKYAAIVISILSMALSYYNLRKGNSKQTYIEKDKQYSDLLKIALKDPGLRDPNVIGEKTKNGDKEFLAKYNVYAFLLWNCIETFYDLAATDSGFLRKQKAVDNT